MNIHPHDRDLEKFTGGPNKPAQFGMRVSLSRYGVLTFNKNAYAELGKPAAVYLYFSRLRDLIAVEPVQSINLPAAFPVLEKNISGYRINAAPFCRHYGICLDTTRDEFVSVAANDPTTHDAPQRNPSMQRNTWAADQLGHGRQDPSGQPDAG